MGVELGVVIGVFLLLGTLILGLIAYTRRDAATGSAADNATGKLHRFADGYGAETRGAITQKSPT